MKSFVLTTLYLVTMSYAGDCPPGAHMVGAAPPEGTERGCKKQDKNGNLVKHGKWFEWYVNGQKHIEGQYHEDSRVGVWTWWYPSGKKMQQGYFVRGNVAGIWKQWDEEGRIVKREEGSRETSSNTQEFSSFANALEGKFGKKEGQKK